MVVGHQIRFFIGLPSLLVVVVSMGSLPLVHAGLCEQELLITDDLVSHPHDLLVAADDTSLHAVTERFERLFVASLEQGYLSGEALAAFYQKLTEDRLTNPMDEAAAKIDIAKLSYWKTFERLITEEGIDLAILQPWLESRLQIVQQQKQAQNETRQETQSLFRPMGFTHVARGGFIFRQDNVPDRQVVIDHDFELQATPVTQWQWAFVAGHSEELRQRLRQSYALDSNPDHRNLNPLNPSLFNGGPESRVLEMAGHKIRMRPDHPVEMVSAEDVKVFLEILNRWSQENDPRIYQLITDHAEGAQYGLPSEEEWQYAATGRGRVQSAYPWGDDKSLAPQYAWFGSNSASQTHEVGLLRPLLVDGQPVFDLTGNVWEWTRSLVGSSRVFRGGSWLSSERFLRSAWRGNCSPGNRDVFVGFRLVRTQP